MQPSPPSNRRGQPDRRNVDIVPEQIPDAKFYTTRIHRLMESETFSRFVDHNTSKDQIDVALTEVKNMLVARIVGVLETNERNGCRSYHPQEPRRVRSTLDEMVPRLALSSLFDNIVYIIAVQLLETCYTILPASSAYEFPIFHQRKEPRVITALHLHSHYRFAPAAGYHARECSETSSWPGLYTGPSSEDVLAEIISERRRIQQGQDDTPGLMKRSEYRSEQTMDASQWSDGQADHGGCRTVRANRSSSSQSDSGFMSRLKCQAPVPKVSQKASMRFFQQLLGKGKHPPQQQNRLESAPASPRPSFLRRLTTPTISKGSLSPLDSGNYSISYSSPTIPSKGSAILDARRNSSDPAIGNRKWPPFEIPEIRRISATTMGSLVSAPIHARPDSWSPHLHSSNSSRKMSNSGWLSPLSLFDGDSSSLHRMSGSHSPNSRQNDYFAPYPLPALEEKESSSTGSREEGTSGPYYAGEASHSDSDSHSDDSVDNERKRKAMVGRLKESVEEFSKKLQEQEESASEKGRMR